MSCRLAGPAAEDIIEILEQGIAMRGEAVARAYCRGLHDTFALLGSFPEMARLRSELDPPVRIHSYGSHIIVYEDLQQGNVRILRVRHAREDWVND